MQGCRARRATAGLTEVTVIITARQREEHESAGEDAFEENVRVKCLPLKKKKK